MPLSTPCWHVQTRFIVLDEKIMSLRKKGYELAELRFLHWHTQINMFIGCCPEELGSLEGTNGAMKMMTQPL